ncbi:hypothetical protein FT663_04479 [Candidozyma haemuli var. vulneris]|uniref:Brl1/Brr6 domain-containing protein n=1 Tax=Candidozyma haemuli TaxID=45357 RepID=A0A2V1AQ93_9ASCO|nr:hypothetical protein CXQ85_001828 [[Candida] haemuloni]KAF3987384.1 hypothetical protein FT663_04479 [[Candida] haemuloni var. vulneris]KAF3993152.1 hypothetical protein FT662_00780 [[Candida] haemuloni var. vulneris]PVH20049.1 hypothetical protein CXQ85_001828 [[Candida] haemuloni]
MDLDKVLVSLSLRENLVHAHSDDDDAMDIDSDVEWTRSVPQTDRHASEKVDSAEDQISIDMEKEEDVQPEEYSSDTEDNSERSLVVSLFSPTRLGARFAINNRNERIEHEELEHISKSSSPAPFIQENHKSTFSTARGSDLYYNPRYTVQEPEDNQPNQRPFVPFPVQVHHHHYYNGMGDALAGTEPRVRYRSHGHEVVGAQEPLQVQELPQPKESIVRSQLPLPWDATSSPAEERAYMLSSYLQLAINSVVSAYALHLVWSVVAAIRKDVAHKLSRHANNLLVEIASCERSYRENHCSPDEIVPALEKMCAYWEQCMLQDPDRGGNVSSLGAQTIGMVITSLVEPLSLKTLAVFACAILLVYVYNFGFGYVRARTYYGS